MSRLDDLDLEDDLPTTQDEDRIINQYFEQKKEQIKAATNDMGLQTAFYFTLLFVLLNNPISDQVFKLIGSDMVRYLTKMVVFFILSYLVILANR